MTYGQYENPPFGTVPQSTGLGGSETGGDRGTPDSGPATAPQSYSTGLDSPQHSGAHFLDEGTADYTDPFALLSGSNGASRTGSTGTALSSATITGIGDYDGAETGIGQGTVGHGKDRL